MIKRSIFALSLLPVCLLAQGQPPPDVATKVAALESAVQAAQSAGDNAWMLVSAALVLMMTGPGLALFYGGLVRRKNVLGTMMQSFILMAVVTVLWALVGYSIAFGEGTAYFGDLRYLFLNGVGSAPNTDYAATIPQGTFMVYQLMFAIITPALISGAFAERMKFSAMLIFTILWALFVYFPMAHMVWGKGGLLNAFLGGAVPTLDFAGGTVVHITSGVSALVCAMYLGKRVGYTVEPMKPHNLVISVIGACLLWVGWFGFNAGSALGASSLATSAFVATHFAAATATLGWVAMEWLANGKPSVLGGISGAVAGLVAITPAAGFVTPMSALLIGLLAGIICYFMVVKVKSGRVMTTRSMRSVSTALVGRWEQYYRCLCDECDQQWAERCEWQSSGARPRRWSQWPDREPADRRRYRVGACHRRHAGDPEGDGSACGCPRQHRRRAGRTRHLHARGRGLRFRLVGCRSIPRRCRSADAGWSSETEDCRGVNKRSRQIHRFIGAPDV